MRPHPVSELHSVKVNAAAMRPTHSSEYETTVLVHHAELKVPSFEWLFDGLVSLNT